METVNEINLEISESQDVNELNAEELEAVAGGGLLGAVAGGAFGGLAGMAAYTATWGFNNLMGKSEEFDLGELNEKAVEGMVTGAISGGVATLVA